MICSVFLWEPGNEIVDNAELIENESPNEQKYAKGGKGTGNHHEGDDQEQSCRCITPPYVEDEEEYSQEHDGDGDFAVYRSTGVHLRKE